MFDCVDATEEQQKEAEMSTVSHHTSHPTRRRASPWGSPDCDQEALEEEVHRRVAKRVRQLPTPSGTTADEDSCSDDEDQPAHR